MFSNQKKHQKARRKGIFLSATLYSVLLSFLIGNTLFLSGCNQSETKQDPVTGYTEKDFYPEKVSVDHAKGFQVSYGNNYKVLQILTFFEDTSDTLQYLLLERGTPRPAGYSNAQVVEIPLKSLVVMASAHIGLADFVESADILIGLGSLEYVTSPLVRQQIKEGKVKETGIGEAMNIELLISMKPGLIMGMGSPDARLGTYKTLREAGIPTIINGEWLETSPLGRAEWVKLMAVLMNKEALVNEKFSHIEREYERLTTLAQSVENKPSIIMGMPFKGTWFVADGGSYMGSLLKDASANYKWSEGKGVGSIPLDFEAVSPVALLADYWINVGYVDSKEDIRAKDARFDEFKPFKKGTIFNNNKKVNDIGANDYWESGTVNPHLVLADLIGIFHPELLPGHELLYYKKLD